MPLDKDYKLSEYVKRCESPYSVVMTVASIARQRCKEWGGLISESEALTWVIRNEEPEIVKEFGGKIPTKTEIDRRKYKTKYEFINDFLSEIDDPDIKDAVKTSYLESLKRKNLVYKYNDINNPSMQARIRVLTRMLWNSGMK